MAAGRDGTQEIVKLHRAIDKRALQQKIPEHRYEERHRQSRDGETQIARDAPKSEQFAVEAHLREIFGAIGVQQQRTHPHHEIFYYDICNTAVRTAERPLIIKSAVDHPSGYRSRGCRIAAAQSDPRKDYEGCAKVDPCRHLRRRHSLKNPDL